MKACAEFAKQKHGFALGKYKTPLLIKALDKDTLPCYSVDVLFGLKNKMHISKTLSRGMAGLFLLICVCLQMSGPAFAQAQSAAQPVVITPEISEKIIRGEMADIEDRNKLPEDDKNQIIDVYQSALTRITDGDAYGVQAKEYIARREGAGRKA